MAFNIILVAFLCVAVILPSAAYVSTYIIRQVLQDDLVTRTKQVLDFNYQLIRFQVNRARLTLESLAKDPMLADALSKKIDDPAMRQIAARFDDSIGLVKFLENIALQESTCELVVADRTFSSQNVANFFQSDYCRGPGRKEGVYISGQFVSVLSGRPVMMMSVPVRDEAGAEIGLVSAVLDIADLSVYLRDLQQPGQYTVVLDRYDSALIDTRASGTDQGNIAVHDPVVARAIREIKRNGGNNGVFESSPDRSGVVAAFDKYAEDPGQFTLVSVEPRSLANRLERKIVMILSLSGLGMLVVLLSALWITVQLSTRRLNQMTETVRRIAGGARKERLPEKSFESGDEVGTLGRSFNAMIDRIHASQTQLREAKAKSDAILLGIGDGVVAIGTDGKIILFNRAAERISGRVARESLGKPYGSVLRFAKAEDQAPDDSFVRHALAGKLSIMPDGMLLMRPDGSSVPVADSSAPIMAEDGTVAGAVIVFRDVTHEREVDRLKTEFVSVASHQLRTPLTAIRWYLEDLQSQEIGPLLSEQKASVDQAVASTGRMISLVNDLLNVSRLETGRLSLVPKPTDIAEVLRDVVQENAGIAAAKGCSIRLHLPDKTLPPIGVDPTLIRQVAANLVSNAVKYACPETGKPQVDVTLTKDGRHYYRIAIKDNGMGIGAADKTRIFERFFRADNAVKKQAEGSGLGLYIAKLIIEESGGMISFDSEEGRGSTFWFLLPIAGSKGRGGGKTLTANRNKT